MFDESEAADENEDDDIPSLVDGEHISEFIHDFFESPPSKKTVAKKEVPVEEEKKEEIKEEVKEEDASSDKPIDPSQDLLN